MAEPEPLIPKHGGYRKLKSFQVAQLIYDLTVLFCGRYVDRRSRTVDQMVQAARSGVQNIAEGSQAGGTSKAMEIKLTNVARASLEELRLDYEDFLRQRELPRLPPDHPALLRFKARRCATVEAVREWVAEERAGGRKDGAGKDGAGKDEHGRTPTHTDQGEQRPLEAMSDGAGAMSVTVRDRLCSSLGSSTLAANAVLSLLNLCCYLLDRQLAAQAQAFENEGGFSERMYRIRQDRRREK